MRHHGFAILIALVMLVPVGCDAGKPPALAAATAAWCEEHLLPDISGGVSVAGVAVELKIASADVTSTLRRVDAEMANGVAIMKRQVAAMAAGDTAASNAALEEYRTWQAEELALVERELAAAVATWHAGPEFAEACATAYSRRVTAAASALPTPDGRIAPTPSPTEEATPKPTPTAPLGLTVGNTINYTSSTYTGRPINLTVSVRNRGGASGRFTVTVDGVGFTLKSRAPLGGCKPTCWGEMSSDGLAYAQWNVPKTGKTGTYTVQLKARTTGTLKLRVVVFDKSSSPYFPLGSWNVSVRVR